MPIGHAIDTSLSLVQCQWQEEGLDTAVIDFISFTENKINRFLVVEFIISLLLKGKEPLFLEVNPLLSPVSSKVAVLVCLFSSQQMQYKLSIQLTQNYDMMNELEFHTAMEKHRLYG